MIQDNEQGEGAQQADGLSPTVEPLRVSPVPASIPSADGSNWTAKTVAVWQTWYCGPYVAYKRTFDGDWLLQGNDGPLGTYYTLQDCMADAADFAKGMEARRAVPNGAVNDSPVPEGNAPNPSSMNQGGE